MTAIARSSSAVRPKRDCASEEESRKGARQGAGKQSSEHCTPAHLDNVGATFGDHGGEATNENTEASDIGEAAQGIGENDLSLLRQRPLGQRRRSM